MRSFTSAAALLLLVIVACAAPALGHGYLSNPPSRQAQCNRGQVANCGQVQYEPQSVEAVKGKTTCNGDVATWAVLADDTMPWVVTPLTAGTNYFTWTLTAVHATASYEYYIGSTRVGFFPTTAPPVPTTHAVDLSGYSGRQKILAIWNIGDTADAFYACVDVNIGGGTGGSTTPTTAPTIAPTTAPTTAPTVQPTTAPTSAPTTTTPTTTITGCPTTLYTIVAGDTLSGIATRVGITLASLVAVNPTITNPDLIYIAQVITIPSAGCANSITTTTTAPTTTTRRRRSGYNETDGSTGDAIEGATPPVATTSGDSALGTTPAQPAPGATASLYASAAHPSATLPVMSACVTLLGVVALAFAQ